MQSKHKSGTAWAAALLCAAAAAAAQQPYSAAADRTADRTATRSFDNTFSNAASLTNGISLAGGSSNSIGSTPARPGMVLPAGANITPANIASICARGAARAQVSSACASLGYTPHRTAASATLPRTSAAAAFPSSFSEAAMDTDLAPDPDALAEDSGEDAPAADSAPAATAAAPSANARRGGVRTLSRTHTAPLHGPHRPAPSAAGRTTPR